MARRWLANKIRGAVWRWSSFVHGFELRRHCVVGAGLVAPGRTIVEAPDGASITIGNNVRLINISEATALGVSHPVVLRCLTSQASISIGDNCGLSGTSICAAASVTIGDRCLFGADAMVFDTDFHDHSPEARSTRVVDWARISKPVVIEDDVFVGTRAIITKGVRVGAGAIVAAGSIVTRDVPPNSIVAGNPARVVKTLSPGEKNLSIVTPVT